MLPPPAPPRPAALNPCAAAGRHGDAAAAADTAAPAQRREVSHGLPLARQEGPAASGGAAPRPAGPAHAAERVPVCARNPDRLPAALGRGLREERGAE